MAHHDSFEQAGADNERAPGAYLNVESSEDSPTEANQGAGGHLAGLMSPAERAARLGGVGASGNIERLFLPEQNGRSESY